MSRIEPLDRDIGILLAEFSSPQAQADRLAQFAADQIAEARELNRSVAGRDVPFEQIVDGKKGAALSSVKPNGIVVANFDLLRDVLEWIGEQLLQESPRLTGRYQRSHILLADAVEVPMNGTIPAADVYRFLNTQPYARKIEPKSITVRRRDRSGPIGTRRKWATTYRAGAGQSQQAPDGVYSAIALVAAKRYGNLARIEYRTDWFDEETRLSHPSIVVRPF